MTQLRAPQSDGVLRTVLMQGCDCPRIRLRPLKADDAADMFRYASDAETCRFLSWGPYTEVAEAQAFIEKQLERYAAPSDIVWGIEEKADGALIGVLRIFALSGDGASVSYILSRSYMGKGYMTEAVKAAVDVCFQKLQKRYVTAYYAEGNERSRRVMELAGMHPRTDVVETAWIKGTQVRLHHYEIRNETI